MKNMIKDIKIVKPEDKLILTANMKSDRKQIRDVVKMVNEFMEGKKQKCLVLSDSFDVYIMKNGSKVLLKDYLNKKIQESI